MKALYIFLILLLSLLNASSLAQDGVTIKIKDKNGKTEEVDVYREISDDCKYDFKFTPQNLWGEKFASKKVPEDCKVTIVSAIGKISPIKIAKGVETYGELEVLAFLKKMQKDKNLLFIDSRTPNWYKFQTIPGAINIPYTYFLKPNSYQDEYNGSLKILGVRKSGDKLDFSNVKEILLFCNGPWCGQSPIMIKKLLDIGYPANKIKWYRGGMHSWNSLNMTTTKDN